MVMQIIRIRVYSLTKDPHGCSGKSDLHVKLLQTTASGFPLMSVVGAKDAKSDMFLTIYLKSNNL